ncbi:MAG: FAD-binding protein [candidate division Zixibacteria bacterium]|nr:FAD-binding protein [Candidatus Tariuqbacter arcticus]
MGRTPPVLKSLRRKLGKSKILNTPETGVVYSSDVNWRGNPPLAVIFPECAEDVSVAVRIAAECGTPVSTRGAGTGMSGGAVPSNGAIVLSMVRMKRIRILEDEKIAVVEPGVITAKLQTEALKRNLFYPSDPSSYKICTIGGNIAENAGGLRCLKYGVTADFVLGTEFINPEGDLIAAGCFTDYDSPVDITPLLCGSEGTLGIIVKAALRLIDAPQAHLTMRAEFTTAIEAAKAVTAILNSRYSPCIMEMIDRQTLKAVTSFIKLDISPKTGAVLLIEYDEEADINRELGDKTSQLCRRFGATGLRIAESEEERENLWKLRRSISPSLTRLASGKINEDVAVPRGRIAELMSFVEALSAELNMPIPTYGHAGDGNMHVNFIFQKEDPAQVEAACQGVKKVFTEVIKMGGTISGEHGIGLAKRDFLPMQLNPVNMTLQTDVKRCFDPGTLFNPDKMLPPREVSSKHPA